MLLSHLSTVLVLAASSFTIGLVATFATRAIARRVGFVAKPRGERWHKRPTALGGGIAIFLAFFPTVLYAGGSLRGPLLAGATAMFLLGVCDDLFQLRPYTKLTGQLLIAGVTVALGQTLPWTPWPLVNQAISLFWIIGLTNAINLLDNMDGLATGVAAVVTSFQAAFFWLQHQPTEAAICAALAGALLSFLVFNWNPASIFMGDGGSLFLGYTLSVLAFHHNYGRSRNVLAVIAVPVLVMLVPIFDTTFVTVMRLLRGRPVSQGGRDHTSHRLVTLGLSERTAVSTLVALAALGGAIALSARLGFAVGIWVGAPLLIIGIVFLAIHLARTDEPVGADSHSPLGWIATFAYKRRIFEVLLDVTLAMVSLFGAFMLRFDTEIPAQTQRDLIRVFPVLVATKVTVLFLAGVYDGVWRYIGVRDVLKFARGSVLATAASLVIVALWMRLGTLSRGALIIDGILFASLLGSSRVGFRVLRLLLRGPEATQTRVLLWGAGDVGADLVRRLLDTPQYGLVPVGFVDDAPAKLGRTVSGLRVLGCSDAIPDLIRHNVADQILVTTDKIDSARLSEVLAHIGRDRVRRFRLVIEDVAAGASGGHRALPEVT